MLLRLGTIHGQALSEFVQHISKNLNINLVFEWQGRMYRVMLMLILPRKTFGVFGFQGRSSTLHEKSYIWRRSLRWSPSWAAHTCISSMPDLLHKLNLKMFSNVSLCVSVRSTFGITWVY